MIFCVRLTENWALRPVSWLNVTPSPPSVIIFVKEPLVTVMEHFMVMTPFCYDATLHRRRLFYQSWSAPAVWKSSTSLDRNTQSHSNYSTFSVQLVLHLTCHYVLPMSAARMTNRRRYLSFMVMVITSLFPLLRPDDALVITRHGAFYCSESIGGGLSVDMIVSRQQQ